ncbi:MAG: TRIC cation channel family protein [Betaproteobacteria bacterium]
MLKKYFLFALLAILPFISSGHAQNDTLTELKIQLPWTHSSQFTGFYIAQIRKHFEKEGLKVKLIEGGPNMSAITELQEGRVDIAISGLVSAWKGSTEDHQVTNVAQIISGSGLVVVCRISSGVYGPKDIIGKKIGIFDGGDRSIVEDMLHEFSIPLKSVELIKQKPGGIDLVNKNVACVTAMLFDQYLQIIEKGVSYSDLIVINPSSVGVPALLDGVYVNTSQLQSPEFRKNLVGFIRALREGWKETRIAPTLSLEAVRSVSNNFEREHELRSLETMLTLIPSDPKQFGLLDLKAYEEESARYLKQSNGSFIPPNIWTHQIWNTLENEDGVFHPFTIATKFYVEHISHLILFKILVYFGVFTYALSGVLEAIQRNYDLWGRVILAFLSGIGGGTIRDLIIGVDRMPFYYVKDYHYPLGIIIVVILTSVTVGFYPNAYKSEVFKKVKKYSDVFGFSALATAGAIISISADMPWFWVPALAALTCAGGGMLRDIVINQEPMTFKGVIYEEAAVIGGIFIVAGLILSNNYEHSSIPVYLTIFSGMALIVFLRLIVYHFGLRYPSFLGGSHESSH